MTPKNNVIRVPPRRYRVIHKGMHGWVEFHPSSKMWSYSFKFQTTNVAKGEMKTEAEAVLQIKTVIDLIKSGSADTSIRSID